MKKWTKILLIIVIVILLLFVGMSYFIGTQVFMGSTQLVTCEDSFSTGIGVICEDFKNHVADMHLRRLDR